MRNEAKPKGHKEGIKGIGKEGEKRKSPYEVRALWVEREEMGESKNKSQANSIWGNTGTERSFPIQLNTSHTLMVYAGYTKASR